MSSQFFMQLPDHLQKAYAAGKVVVESGVVRHAKDTVNAGQIVAHLEPTRHMSTLGISAISPHAAIALEMGKAAKGVMDTAKLNQIIQLTQSVKMLSAVNLAVSGVSLGVSVVGFAMVLHKLGQIDKQLTSVAARLDSIGRNEILKLIREVKLSIRDSITLVHKLDEQKLSDDLDREIERHLNKIEILLEDLMGRYISQEDINVSFELAQYLYGAYANLLKVYLTARYKNKKILDKQVTKIKTLETFSTALMSPDFLDELYEVYLTNQEHRFLESELDYILELYQYGCQNTFQAVSSHHEILMTVPLRRFRRWEKVTGNSQNPFLWIEHGT